MIIAQEKNLIQMDQSRNYQPQQVTKTFVFEKIQTKHSQILDFAINMLSDKIDLSTLFQKYCPLNQHTVFIYDPETNQFILLSDFKAETSGKVPKLLLETNTILIRYRRKGSETQCPDSESPNEEIFQQSRQKKDRSKERTIGESILLVKQWRNIHQTSNKSGIKKLSLLQAAKQVGISKKSLDDYYYQLRLGQYYNFDFANHLDQKIGILRRYVKEFKPSREMNNKNIRHPKNLKIIQSILDKLPNVQDYCSKVLSPIIDEVHTPSFKNLSIKEYSIGERDMEVGVLQDVNILQANFFKNFQFLLDDAIDPFIEMSLRFQKAQSSQQILFF